MALANPVPFLVDIGVVDLFIPFLVFFTVIFALLQRAALFAEKRVNAIIALAFALLIVLPHVTGTYPTSFDPVVMLNSILPGAGVLMIVILLALMLVGLVGVQPGSSTFGWIGVAGLVVLGIIVLNTLMPDSFPWLSFAQDPGLQAAAIVILVFGLVVWFVMGGEEISVADAETRRTAFWKRFFGLP